MDKGASGLPFEVNQELFDALSPLMEQCDRHRLRLLSECPKCRARFQVPSQWMGNCQRCGFEFGDMQSLFP
jgi:hypothetical protein